MDRSARLPWHSKGLLKDRFLSMDFTRICRDDGSPAQKIKTCSRVTSSLYLSFIWIIRRLQDEQIGGLQTASGERESQIWSYLRNGKSCNSPQWRGWWWVWRCSAPPPRWPPLPCSAPPPEEEGLCRSPSPTDAATPTEILWLNNTNTPTRPTTQYIHIHRYMKPPWFLGRWFSFLGFYPASSQWAPPGP